MDTLTLEPVTLAAAGFLYDLLKERDPSANISHREMPPFFKHCKFIESKPYAAWYLVLCQDDKEIKPIASVYLTRQDEIGLFLVKDFQGKGYGSRILGMLMKAEPRERYLANVAPSNEASRKFFAGQGFKHIQNTFELRAT
jgi:RimJ/RimL family protein N-acetyltransferase